MSDLCIDLVEMLTLEEFHDSCDENGYEVSIFTDYDAAIIGMAQQGPKQVAVYSYDLLIQLLKDLNEWGDETATEWYAFNMTDYHDGCPVVLHTGIYREPTTTNGVNAHGTG